MCNPRICSVLQLGDDQGVENFHVLAQRNVLVVVDELPVLVESLMCGRNFDLDLAMLITGVMQLATQVFVRFHNGNALQLMLANDIEKSTG